MTDPDALPNLLIIGAPKAGTTSLHAYIAKHPDASMSEPKELRYFWRDDWWERRQWYASHFDAGRPVRGESTPAYAAWPHRADVPERAARLVPDAKLIYVLRDPIERIASHWSQRIADGFPDSFESYVDDLERPDNPIIAPSRYGTQADRWLQHFDREQLLILDQHDLKVARDAVMAQVFAFLGLPAVDDLDFDEELNTRADKTALVAPARALWDRVLWPASRRTPQRVRDLVRGPANRLLFRAVRETADIDASTRARLEAHLKPEVQRIREISGRDFATWSI